MVKNIFYSVKYVFCSDFFHMLIINLKIRNFLFGDYFHLSQDTQNYLLMSKVSEKHDFLIFEKKYKKFNIFRQLTITRLRYYKQNL